VSINLLHRHNSKPKWVAPTLGELKRRKVERKMFKIIRKAEKEYPEYFIVVPISSGN
jgi:hypothetical protein